MGLNIGETDSFFTLIFTQTVKLENAKLLKVETAIKPKNAQTFTTLADGSKAFSGVCL